MKRFFLLVTLSLLAGTCVLGQVTHDDYLRRYANLTARVGVAGVGVEPLLDHWEADHPDDVDLHLARFSFWFSKCQSSSVIQLDQDRYLGQEPLLPMKDSTGKRCNYFEDITYDDLLFGQAQAALQRAIDLSPGRLDLRFYRISALTSYEKDSPDLALAETLALVDRQYQEHPAWDALEGQPVTDTAFVALVQEACYRFFRIGTPGGWEAFRAVSERMLTHHRNHPVFMDNLGSYYLVYKKDHKKALKYYNKVLKAHPDDDTALRNCLLLARSRKDRKLEAKYLAHMARYGATETDRASAAARLEVLRK